MPVMDNFKEFANELKNTQNGSLFLGYSLLTLGKGEHYPFLYAEVMLHEGGNGLQLKKKEILY